MAKKMSMRERVRQKALEKKDRGSRGKPYLKLPDGVEEFKATQAGIYKLDVIPYVVKDSQHPDQPCAVKGELWHSRRIFVHKNVGLENKQFLCLLKNKGKACPICEHFVARQKQGAQWKELKEFSPQERWLLNVIDIKNDPKSIKVWDASDFSFGSKLDSLLQEEDENYADFAELEGGYTLQVGFKEKTFNERQFFDPDNLALIPRTKNYKESILEHVACLDEILVYHTYEQIDRAFNMVDDAEDDKKDTVEEDDLPWSTDSKTNKTKTRKPEPEPESEDGEGEDDETEDLAPSKRTLRTPLRKPKPKPEPEEEDDD